MIAALVRPAPKPTKQTLSPFLILPERTASSKAVGIDALEVLPCLSSEMMNFSIGAPRFLAAVSIILTFA